MHTKLRDFMPILAYGTRVCVIKYPEDIVIYSSDYFSTPYSIPKEYEDVWRNNDIQCVGIVEGVMYIWI